MFGVLSLILGIVQIAAPIIAAVYAYKAYELVKLERDIRIAREAAEAEASKEPQADEEIK